MTPLLLDQRSIFKAGITISLALSAVFISGYYLGLQNSGLGEGLGLNKTIALALPRPAHADTGEYAPQVPQALLPGATIDVDSPDATLATQQQEPGKTVDRQVGRPTGFIGNADAGQGSAPKHDEQLQLASLAIPLDALNTGIEPIITEQQPEIQAREGDEQPSSDLATAAAQSLIIDTASAEDARYTIQVGVFSASENAIRRMSELESQSLSAYTQGYANKRNQLRFNVRFGYFNNKASAAAALNLFEKDLAGSGYITRIRRD